MIRCTTTLLLCATLLTACGGDEGWTRLGQALTTQQEEQSRRAVAARDAMFQKLFAELQGAVQKGGPVAAIGVCKTSAPAIASAIGTEHGVRIGRTARKLRNPGNTAPDWARSYVDSEGDAPVQLAHADGRFAALLPIHLKVGCLGCHGPAASIQPDVKAALARLYPDDRATGFAAGDLRGWFWVEVPAP